MDDALPPAVPAAAWRQEAFVAGATVAAGVLGYGFNLVMSRELGPNAFGELSALLAVAILASVPGTALQAGIARRLALHPDRADERRVLGESALVALAVGLGVLALGPALRAGLAVRSWADVVWLAALMVPTTVAFGCLGVLQGRRRFLAFGRLLIAVQAAKLAGGLLAAGTGTGVAGALGATTVLTGAVALAGAVAVTPDRVRLYRLRLLRAALAADALALLGVLLLGNLDLVLARHFLGGHQSGLYAAGNLVAKVAFWGPSFVATVAYPRLARPDQRPAALRRGWALLLGFALATSAAVAAGRTLVPVVVGAAYRPVAGIAWLFALEGAGLAAVLFGVYAGLAVADRRLAGAVWAVAAAETVAVAARWHASIGQVLGVALAGTAVLLLAALGLGRRGADRRRRS